MTDFSSKTKQCNDIFKELKEKQRSTFINSMSRGNVSQKLRQKSKMVSRQTLREFVIDRLTLQGILNKFNKLKNRMETIKWKLSFTERNSDKNGK